MHNNFSVVPKIITKDITLAAKMTTTFVKMAKTIVLPKRFERFNHMKNLSLIYMKLTPLCNLHCVMCGQHGDKGVHKGECAAAEAKTIPSLEVYERMIEELARTARPVFYLWGGEPLLYPDILPLVRCIKKHGMVATLNTNGTLLEKYAEDIVRDKWDTLFVSLDGFRDVNDKIRGKNSYDRVIRGFEAINREKKRQNSSFPFLGVVTTVTNMNYLYLEEFAEALRSYNLDWHVFNLGTYTNDSVVAKQRAFMKEHLDTDIDCLEGYNTGYNLGIDGKKLHQILKTLHDKNYGHPMITVPVLNPEKTHTYYADLETPVRNHCIVPWCQTNINYNGDVHFCADYPDYILGNLKEQTISEIYNGERANKFRRTIYNCEGGLLPGCLRCYQNMLFGKKIKGY